MSLNRWLQEILCAELRRELINAESAIEDLKKKLGESELALQKSIDKYSELLTQGTTQKNELDRLKIAYNDAIKALSNAGEIPDISKILEQAGLKAKHPWPLIV